MAWKYPYHLIKRDFVVDNIALDENFLSVVEETSGYLNEHNFAFTPGSAPFIEEKCSPRLWDETVSKSPERQSDSVWEELDFFGNNRRPKLGGDPKYGRV